MKVELISIAKAICTRTVLIKVVYAIVIFPGGPVCFCGWQPVTVSVISAGKMKERVAKRDCAWKWIIFFPHLFKLGGR